MGTIRRAAVGVFWDFIDGTRSARDLTATARFLHSTTYSAVNLAPGHQVDTPPEADSCE